ncbi:hypothetical protein [Ruegeria profundi]|uniref:hypothetical protein n=1 Tax=Ruegeria profundi TaxID=1685378 RepID=UPI001CD6ABCD|nr:hypothetical protein [Ruegeria profundi]MCA0927151.1 hypothetical protein [Ruegeria profundi]
MFEPSGHPDYRLATEKHGDLIICSVQRIIDGKIVATGQHGELTYHVPTNDQVKETLTQAAQPWFDRLKEVV